MKSLPALFICLVLFGLCLHEKKSQDRDLQQLNSSEKPLSEKSKFFDNSADLSSAKDSLALIPEVSTVRYPLTFDMILLKN